MFMFCTCQLKHSLIGPGRVPFLSDRACTKELFLSRIHSIDTWHNVLWYAFPPRFRLVLPEEYPDQGPGTVRSTRSNKHRSYSCTAVLFELCFDCCDCCDCCDRPVLYFRCFPSHCWGLRDEFSRDRVQGSSKKWDCLGYWCVFSFFLGIGKSQVTIVYYSSL